MPKKEEIAALLASAHVQAEPTITKVVQLVGEGESLDAEPIKLLEVNPATSASGIVPIAFGPSPPSVPFPSVVVEVTQREFDEIRAGRLPLPKGWRLGRTLYSAAA